ncbi:MAG: hypothetical protein RR234_01960 [Christensenella sp.]
MSETALNAIAQQFEDLTLCKSRYDEIDIQWYAESPYWRRNNMKYSREYKILPDYEIADAKHGRSLLDILDESAHLTDTLKLYKKTMRDDERQRVNYLIDHVEHLNFRTKMLLGEKTEFDVMTDALYSLKAPSYDYKKFDDICEELNQALPGTGSAQEKIWDFRNKIAIPQERLLKVLKETTQVFHDISMQRMHITGNSMPRIRVRDYPNENMAFLSILFGYDYNHLEYERNFNLRYPWTVDNVVECICHEMEPGHLSFYEKRTQTMIDTCWPEMAIVSQFSSSSAFTEGSARYLIPMCFELSIEKQMDFEREYIFKNASIDIALADLMPLWHKYCEIVGYGKLEVTRNVWDKTWNEVEAAHFLKKYAFVGKEFESSDVCKLAADEGHFVAHDYARDVVKEYFNAVAPTVDEQWRLYEKLCCSHMSMREIEDKSFKIDF